jgi:peroxiredoxin
MSAILMTAGCQVASQASLPKAKPQASVAIAGSSAPVLRQVAPANAAAVSSSPKLAPKIKDDTGPTTHTAFYRADAGPATIPKVMMSKADEALCHVKVGAAVPAISLPKVDGGSESKLADLYGKKATVVVFWKSDRRMAREQLADLGPDVVERFEKAGVAVVGIAVNATAESAQAALKKAGASFPNLLDADGKAFAKLGSGKLPRTYVLDLKGKIVWFDIEYSLATRRELHQTLRAVTGQK